MGSTSPSWVDFLLHWLMVWPLTIHQPFHFFSFYFVFIFQLLLDRQKVMQNALSDEIWVNQISAYDIKLFNFSCNFLSCSFFTPTLSLFCYFIIGETTECWKGKVFLLFLYQFLKKFNGWVTFDCLSMGMICIFLMDSIEWWIEMKLITGEREGKKNKKKENKFVAKTINNWKQKKLFVHFHIFIVCSHRFLVFLTTSSVAK